MSTVAISDYVIGGAVGYLLGLGFGGLGAWAWPRPSRGSMGLGAARWGREFQKARRGMMAGAAEEPELARSTLAFTVASLMAANLPSSAGALAGFLEVTYPEAKEWPWTTAKDVRP